MKELEKSYHVKNIDECAEWILQLAQKLKKDDKRLPHLLETQSQLTNASFFLGFYWSDYEQAEKHIMSLESKVIELGAKLKTANAEIEILKNNIK